MNKTQIIQEQNLANIYEQDYCLWIEKTIVVLREGKLSELDITNLIEEITDMGISQKKAVSSNLQIVLMHLLKYKYQPEKRSNSWRYTIFEHRDRILEAFELSPSLKPYFMTIFDKCYRKARKKASLETGLSINVFPLQCPFTEAETLDTEYLP